MNTCKTNQAHIGLTSIYTIHHISSLTSNTCEYLLLVQHEMGEAPSTQGLDMFWMVLKNGTEVKDGSLALTQ